MNDSDRAVPDARGFSRRARFQLAILLALVFVCGVLGGLVVRRALVQGGEADRPFATSEPYFELFAREFKLDADQRLTLRLILEEKARNQRNWQNDLLQRQPEAMDALRTIEDVAERRIRALLTRPQRKQYDRMLTASVLKRD